MSLTNQDLQSIEKIIDRKNKDQTVDLKEAIERSESRIVMAMGLLQRDTFSSIEDHEHRITQLERKFNS
jgi:hypothetical protein